MAAKMSLLEIVIDILNDLDSDEVNSIDDTGEAVQVAQIVKSTYISMMTNKNWPHTKRLIQITPSGDNALPTHMSLQEEIKELCFINYDCAKSTDGARRLYKEIKYVEPDDFLRMSNSRDNTQLVVSTIVDPSSLTPLNIRNDQAPTYFTSFDDTILIFDSYDSSVDDTLQKSKVQVYAYVVPEFLIQDDFVPDLPVHAFTKLLEEAKSRAAVKIRQVADQKAEQESRRQGAWLSRRDFRVAGGIRYPNYGRNGKCSPDRGKAYRDPTFQRDD